MRCVPTHVQIPVSHPELGYALCGLLAELRAGKLATASDVVQQNGEARWHYFVTIPVLSTRGDIRWVHFFRHDCHPATGEALTIHIVATAEFWPDAGCRVLNPTTGRRRSQAALRLVS